MKTLIRKLLDVLGIAGFIFVLGYLYREQIAGTFLGDIWEACNRLLFGWLGV